MRPITSTLIGIAATIAVYCIFGPAAYAQDRGVIAICPVVFDKDAGTPEARAEAMRTMRSKFEHAGFTVADYDTLATKWKDMGIAVPVEGQPPTPSDLAKFGKAVGALYVLEPEFDFNVKRIPYDENKFTTVKAAMSIFKASDGSRVYNQSETVSKSPKSPGDFRTLSQSGREQRVVDQAIDVSLARFLRRPKVTTK